MKRVLVKIIKFMMLLKTCKYRAALRFGVGAAIEHEKLLLFLKKNSFKTVVDIGANRGQFALVAKHCYPQASIISFEPLPEPASIYLKVFFGDKSVTLHNVAVSPVSGESKMHVSARDDSSSLLPISHLQEKIFPGTCEVAEVVVRAAPLDEFVSSEEIISPALLKLDVQGFELDCLRGCETLLHKFEWIYCECSFVELYSSQKFADDVINWLFDKGFSIKGVYNVSYDSDGQSVQADFLFSRRKVWSVV